MNQTTRWVSVLAVAAALVTTSPSAAQAVDPIVDGQALVRLTTSASIDDFNARYETTTLRTIASRKIYLVELPPNADPEQFKAAADQDPDTVWVELNYYGQVPEARGRCFYVAESEDAQPYVTQFAWEQINLGLAQQESTGSGVVIAIVDSGIDATHVALLGSVLNSGWNFVDDNADTSDVGNGLDDDGDGEIDEMTGHGTHVAGIARWIAPDAMLLPVKVLDSDGNSDNFMVAAGIFYAIDQGVQVSNVSVGSTYNSEGVLDAVLEAQAAGIVVAAAGGNVDTRLPEEYPALNTGAIGVASVGEDDLKGYFSNYHENFVICTPGEGIFSTLPGNLYAAWDGTSMSTPMVSGVAALLLARHPEWPATDARVNNVRIALMRSADFIDDLNPGYEGLLGAGRLNAASALKEMDVFASAVDYPVGLAPESVTVADFDGDGLGDLATTNGDSNTVSILLHQDSETFGTEQQYSVGALPIDLIHADLDGDNDEDLAVANEGTGSVSILRNNGDGTFAPAVHYAVGGSPSAIATGDLDGDADADLAIADGNGGTVFILMNNGDGTFVGGGSVAVGIRPLDVAIVDLDRDGDPDLVTVNRETDNISVARNNGNGTFAPAVHFPVGQNPRALTVADFNGDGADDVATANHDSRDITIAWNDGSGAFNFTTSLSFSDGRRAEQLAAADLDCDGDIELIATNGDEGSSAVSIFLGRGDGTFLQPVHYGVAADPVGVAAEDLTGDGRRDLSVAGSSSNTVSVLLNQSRRKCRDGGIAPHGNPTFAAPQRVRRLER